MKSILALCLTLSGMTNAAHARSANGEWERRERAAAQASCAVRRQGKLTAMHQLAANLGSSVASKPVDAAWTSDMAKLRNCLYTSTVLVYLQDGRLCQMRLEIVWETDEPDMKRSHAECR